MAERKLFEIAGESPSKILDVVGRLLASAILLGTFKLLLVMLLLVFSFKSSNIKISPLSELVVSTLSLFCNNNNSTSLLMYHLCNWSFQTLMLILGWIIFGNFFYFNCFLSSFARSFFIFIIIITNNSFFVVTLSAMFSSIWVFYWINLIVVITRILNEKSANFQKQLYTHLYR